MAEIERLVGKNYQSWKYNIKFVLMERGLWGFVEGTETAPGASAAATVQNAYRQSFRQSLFFNCSVLTRVCKFILFSSMTDPHEA